MWSFLLAARLSDARFSRFVASLESFAFSAECSSKCYLFFVQKNITCADNDDSFADLESVPNYSRVAIFRRMYATKRKVKIRVRWSD